METLHEAARETEEHIAQAKQVGARLGIDFLTLGMSPLWSRARTPMMPKQRYRIMTDYMPKVGSRGLDMMYRTATVQVNLDYESERDMVRKMRVSLALQPVATALFANSPFTEGRPNGFLSMRSEIWRDTDRDRTGMIPFAFEDGFGYERYVDWALDVPMYFIKRDSTYHDVAGSSFRDLLAGRHPARPGEIATRSDWANHVSTLFPEVRLKRYLEMRGADVGPPERIVALSAFWVGLLYDAAALDPGVAAREGLERRGARGPPRRRADSRSTPASPAAPCARSPATRCESLMRASRPARGATRRAPTRPAISPPSTRSPPAARGRAPAGTL